jgi:hypothetical protein
LRPKLYLSTQLRYTYVLIKRIGFRPCNNSIAFPIYSNSGIILFSRSLDAATYIITHTHNHPSTGEYNSITPEGKKKLTTSNDIAIMTTMANNKSRIPEIEKT